MGISLNLQITCSWNQGRTGYILNIKGQRLRSEGDLIWSDKHFWRHIVLAACGKFTSFPT